MNVLLTFDLEFLNYTTVINSLPYRISDATAVRFENKAYIFDPLSAHRKAIELDLDTNRTMKLVWILRQNFSIVCGQRR